MSGDGGQVPPATAPPAEAAESGGMQSDPGARVIDRPDAGDET